MGFNKKTGKNRLDKFYYLAKDQGYRSRAAYKLIQLNQKYNFLSKARVLLDLCAAPGSWMQVATKYMPVSRMCIGVDLDPIRNIPNCHMLQQDITTQECRQEIKKLIGDQEVDVVLHDGAPNMGKSWLQDAYSQAELVLSALRLATVFLKENGVFVSKVFRSQDYNNLMWVFNHFFRKVTATKPTASRAVSAEIFVVCEGYLKPAKIDPKLLDPRFVFREVAEVQKPIDIFAKKKQKRHRTGYDTDSMILFTKASVLQLIHSNDPVKILAQFNALTFEALAEGEDEEEAKLFERHPKTTEEVKACLADLKVLSHKDFKGLLKWRQKMREFAQLGKFAEKEEEVEEEVELTEEQRMNLTEAELNEALAAKNRKKKKRERKRLRLQQRAAMRMGLQTKMADEEFEAPTELGLFSLATLKSDKALNAVATDAEGASSIAKRAVDGAEMMQAIRKGSKAMEVTQKVLDALEQAEKAEEERIKRKAPIGGQDESDDEARTKQDENMLDAMYADYLSKKDSESTKEKAAKARVESRVGMNAAVRDGDALDDFSAYPDADGEESDGEEATKGGLKRNRLLLAEDAREAQVSARAERWFSQDLFKELEEEEDEEEEEERLKRRKEKERRLREEKTRIDAELAKKDGKERSAKRQKTENKAEKKIGEDEDDEQEGFEEVPIAPERRSDESSEEDSEELEKLRKMDARKRSNSDYMDTEPESDESSASDDLGIDPEGYDTDERAEMLALAAKMKVADHVPTERSKVIEASFNRYQFGDTSSLPDWFVEDEQKHTQPNLPVTKEEVEEYKAELKAINSRSTKKVAEAAARKKKRALDKLDKAKSKARSIASNGDMNDREKIKAIQKLYRGQTAKTKPNKIYAVGGNLVKTDMSAGGNARVKLVDARLKKDKRKQKAVLKKKGGRRK